MANANFKVAYTLEEANTVKRALQAQHDTLMTQLAPLPADPPERDAELRHEIGRIETILRRDF